MVELQSHAGEASDEAGLDSEAAEAAAVVSSLFLRAAGAAEVTVSSDTADAAELDSAGGHTHSEAAEDDSVEAAVSDAPASLAAASKYITLARKLKSKIFCDQTSDICHFNSG